MVGRLALASVLLLFSVTENAARIILVTGAAKGIGAAISARFAASGDRIILHWRSDRDEVEAVRSRKPTIADVIDSPREYYEMPPDVLLTLAVAEDEGARTERLVREIMIVDNVSWDDAQPKVQEIAEANMGINSLQTNLSKTYFKMMAFVRMTPFACCSAAFPLPHTPRSG